MDQLPPHDPEPRQPSPSRAKTIRRRRAAVLAAAVMLGLVLATAAVAGGGYAWLSLTFSKANNRPGVDEAREALRETITTTSAAGGTSSSPDPAGPSPGTTEQFVAPDEPGTMNILLLGADRRPNKGDAYGRSDTMMVVHIDPKAGFLSVLSRPRDLRVDLGAHGVHKLNAAYALGGDALAIRAVRNVTGLRLSHFMTVDFAAFQSIIDKIGGIYVDVDRRYYDVGDVLLPIDLQPGYQRLNGKNALRFVRTRHDYFSDWARIKRQQRFVRAAKEQVFSLDMATRVPSLVATLMDYSASDIGATDALRLTWWGAKLNMGRVKLVTLTGDDTMIDGQAFVVASNAQVREAVDALLTPPTPKTTTTVPSDLSDRYRGVSLSGISVELRDAGGGATRVSQTADVLTQHGAKVTRSGVAADPREASEVVVPAQMQRNLLTEGGQVAVTLGVTKIRENNNLQHVVVLVGPGPALPAPRTPVTQLEMIQWRNLAANAGFPVEAPSWLPRGYRYVGSRAYDIETTDGTARAVRATFEGAREQYLGIEETTFLDAPAASPGKTVSVAGSTFTVVHTADRVDRVWWKRNGVLYWLSNTLGSKLTEEQLVKVAASMAKVG